MALIDVVKWEVNPKEFCHKYPSEDLRLGTQLVVYPTQTAFFVKGGKICDTFSEPGTYTIQTDNIPILNKLINLPFGGRSPFKAEILFVNQITRLDMKWGTPTPIQLEDPKYNIIVPTRAYGQYGIKIENPRLFLETLIGNMNSFTADSIDQYFKGKMLSNLNSTIAKSIIEKQVSILDINMHLLDISDYCQKSINAYFSNYGIALADFSIISINVPEDDSSFIKLKEAKATVAQFNLTGRDIYQMQRSFDVLEIAAGNEGAGAQVMGLGVGMGIGNFMSGVANQKLNTDPIPSPPPIPHEATYYVYVNGQQLSGQTRTMIANMIAQGAINDDTLVWTVGMANWAPIKNVPDLASVCPPPITPLPHKE
jgi:membrane protease subunit (stomatin/prohibitin family)